jgi:hypothetical protein
MEEKHIQSIGLTCCCSCCWIIMVLCMSFATITPLEYGFKYNGWTKSIGDTPLESGINWVGPMNALIAYPSN